MARIVSNYTANGSTQTDEYGTLFSISDLIGNSGVIKGMAVAANSSPAMNVYVQTGSAAIGTGTAPTNYSYFVKIDTSGQGELVTVGTSNTSPRIDYIVAYINKSQAGSTGVSNNTNNVFMLADVMGTPSGSPVVPTVGQIQTAIGAANPYIILAQIAVGASVSQITTPNITDLRSFAVTTLVPALGASSYVDSGLVWSISSGLVGAMTAGKAYINVAGVMVPVTVAAIGSQTFVASRDTYVSIDNNGTVSIANAVSNNAASPALPANSVWLAIVVTGASAITSINTGQIGAVAPVVSGRTLMVSDTNGQLIYPKSNQRNVGYAQIASNAATASSTAVQVPGLSTAVLVPAGGRSYKLTAWCAQLSGNTAANLSLVIYDGVVGSGTQLSLSQNIIPASNTALSAVASAIITPSAGLHTFNVGTYTSAGTLTMAAGTAWPAYIHVEPL
jgi:hypothetical protein